MKKSMKNRRQRGFTLIELISVIIILGILAAVIVPKYFDMTDKAKTAAYKGAVSEGVARFNMAYAQYIIETNAKPTDVATLATSSLLGTAAATGVSIGDYKIKYESTTTSLTVTAMNSANSELASTTMPWPN